MKTIFLYLFLMILIPININCQEKDENSKNQYYDLKWKVEKNSPIAYKTAMEPIDNDVLSDQGIDISSLFGNFVDSTKLNDSKIKEFFNALNTLYKDFSLTTIMTKNDKGKIDTKMIAQTNEDEGAEEAKSKPFANMMKGVMLRGLLNENGGIESFWMKREQMNLFSLLFELPEKPVKIGDRWTLQVNLISNDQNFICEEYNKTHIVELLDVKEVEGDLIAFIKYNLNYYVKGDFNNPFLGSSIPTRMELGFFGFSEFNISKGKWKNFDGVLTMDITGIMTKKVNQRIKLIEIDDIPKKILEVK